ncbi:MAG: NAD(P)H-dependent oxidoreductase [Myxococcota bacterium]
MHILAFAATMHSQSINKQLVSYAARQIDFGTTEIVDLNDYELPLFTQDRQRAMGEPELAKAFLAKIAAADALLISFAEHNGSYTAAFKSLFDWCSRIENKVYQDKPMVVLATSPGNRGGKGVLDTVKNSAPFFGGDVRASVSVPRFHENFDTEAGELRDDALREALRKALGTLRAADPA